ncbi:MAG: hypothetical protein UE295_00425 [Acutalibacteraceae bacterium]|nr:hypothetical protein [Acutalibacteraceae bacterium]
MASNICLPNWLNDSKINDLKKDLEYAEPYSQEEFDDLPFDGEIDWKRYNAYSAKKVLEEYGLL